MVIKIKIFEDCNVALALSLLCTVYHDAHGHILYTSIANCQVCLTYAAQPKGTGKNIAKYLRECNKTFLLLWRL
jgi:hypothetical protein